MDVNAEHYKVAEIAARTTAEQLRRRAIKGQPKSPENTAKVVTDAWAAALRAARESDAGGTPSVSRAGLAGLEPVPGAHGDRYAVMLDGEKLCEVGYAKIAEVVSRVEAARSAKR